MVREGKDLAVLTIGNTGNFVNQISERLLEAGIDYAHYDMRFVKPIDEALLHSIFKNFKQIITIEDGTIVGGFGSAVLEFMAENAYSVPVKRLGIPDRFVEQGAPEQLHALCGYGPEGILQSITELMEQKENKKIKPLKQVNQ
jgi:1-deoxy-D-xylulose-5-phosphate synthase